MLAYVYSGYLSLVFHYSDMPGTQGAIMPYYKQACWESSHRRVNTGYEMATNLSSSTIHHPQAKFSAHTNSHCFVYNAHKFLTCYR